MKNITAKVSCFARAYHYKNNPVHIFADHAAGPLLGSEYAQIARYMSQGIGFFRPGFTGSQEEGLRLIVDEQLAPSVLARSAYCENVLENEKRLGCSQYLVFASGYDTYAIRNADPSLSVFELELPEIIADKKERTYRAGLKTDAVYVPCDLAQASWRDQVTESGFLPGLRSFGSLLGISYYLTKAEFTSLIEALGSIMCEGSAICFDYPSLDDSRETLMNQALARAAEEQMKARYSPEEMEVLLAECGFLIYEQLGHGEMTDRFFSDYNRKSPEHSMVAPEGVRYIFAVRKA